MRLIDADELMEHVWRDKLDSRELIAKMVDNAPTVEEIPTKIPIDIFKKLISQEPKTGHWTKSKIGGAKVCSVCKAHMGLSNFNFCPNCGCRMVEPQEIEVKE